MTTETLEPGGVVAAAGRAVMGWEGAPERLTWDTEGCREALSRLDRPCYVVRMDGRVGIASGGEPTAAGAGDAELLAISPATPPSALGDPGFRGDHGLRMSYMAGAMAAGIASEELVVALGAAGCLGSFGAAGLLPDRIEAAIGRIQRALPHGPYAFNLIHSPSEEAIERAAVELYLARGVRTVECSAFLRLTPHVVRYRVAGLEAAPDGSVRIRNRVIAKVSRREVAEQFLSPPPPAIVSDLMVAGLVTEAQARLAARVPMADDLTVEADSGGHTDNRSLVVLLPSLQAQRDELCARWGYAHVPRIGAAGGVGAPEAAAAAFAMGADYLVTGSINQGCVEAGTSLHVRRLLAQAGFADVAMAPAADMFEAGVRVQVLKRGSMFPMRAQRLYELYQRYGSLEEIPAKDREQLERQLFRRPLETVWRETVEYFSARDPEQIERAGDDPRRRMALVFRWYLGLSSRWANTGESARELDYQIWCGPAMGAFNDWARGSHLEAAENRSVAEVARQIMTGAAYLYRVAQLQSQGVRLVRPLRTFRPLGRGIDSPPR